jgi:hypothetical protein
MHAKVMKWLSIAMFLLAVGFWRSAANYHLEPNLAVCIAVVFSMASFGLALIEFRVVPAAVCSITHG